MRDDSASQPDLARMNVRREKIFLPIQFWHYLLYNKSPVETHCNLIGFPTVFAMNTTDFLKRGLNRRQFLGSSAKNAAGMAAGMVGVGLAASSAKAAPSERVNLGIIGVRGQGKSLAEQFASLPQAEVVTVCDIDEAIAGETANTVAEIQGRSPKRGRIFAACWMIPAWMRS